MKTSVLSGGNVCLGSNALVDRSNPISLLAMRDACRERSIPFVVLDHTLPVLRPLPTFCAQSAIPCEDFHFTAEELHQPIYNSAKDTHANARGNELLLQKLRRIAEQLPLPR